MKIYKVFCLIILSMMSLCIVEICALEPLKTKSEINREKLLLHLSGEWISRSLYAATKLGIVDHLYSSPKSIEDLANLTQTNSESLYRLMSLLTAIGIFEEISPTIFSLTEMGMMLAKSHPDGLHNLALFYGEEIHKSWEEFLPSLQKGIPAFQLTYNQPVFSYFKENPERAALFQRAMKEKSLLVFKSVLSTYDFSKSKTVYDIGGGYSQFIQMILQEYPNVTGTVFELPEVVEEVRKKNPNLENKRCKLIAGDFFVSVPKGGDIYFLKSILHDWDDEKSVKILKNCHQAMHPSSRLLIVDVVLQNKEQSIYPNCMDVLMMTITGGKERNLSSFKQILERSGFVLEQVFPTATEFSILEARKK